MDPLRNVCPVDLRKLPPLPVSTEAEVKGAVAAARAAQPGWDALGFAARAQRLKRAAKRMLARRQEVLELLHEEAGKTPGEILMSEALGPLQYVSDWVRVIRPWLKPRRVPMSPIAFPGKRGVTTPVPRGVVGIIAPWNYPLANFFKPLFPALLCGNAVVIKPSEYSPRTAAWLVEVLGEFLPAGVLSCVQGDREVGKLLIGSGIDALTFTGSYASGREVARLAAEQLIPVSLELGGKDAAIVLADCDLERTVAGVMHWALHNAGQACGAIERVYVEASIADRFVDRLASAVSHLRVGSGDPRSSDVGPLVHQAQLEIVEAQVKDAVALGARVLCGGKRSAKGLWFQPTVLDRCTHQMKVMTEPTFGPLIPVVRVTDAEEAVQLANSSEYGLNGSVWSKDRARAAELAKKLEAGTVFVNNHAFTGAIAAAPWTGVKHTGYGVANSTSALNHYTRPRTLVVDRSSAPEPYWFPVNETLEELGHRLADAQLAKIGTALKIPYLIWKRQREVRGLVRGGSAPVLQFDAVRRERSRAAGAISAARARVGPVLSALADRVQVRLSRKELAWGKAVFEATFPRSEAIPLPALPSEEQDAFLQDIHAQMPLLPRIGLRAALWTAGLAPVVFQKRLATLDQLSPEEQLKTVEEMYQSELYLLRQISVVLKTTGALAQASTSRFQTATQAAAAATLRPVAEA